MAVWEKHIVTGVRTCKCCGVKGYRQGQAWGWSRLAGEGPKGSREKGM